MLSQMLQLSEKRTNALNYNAGKNKDVINRQIAEYQEKEGIHFADVKGLFEHLLSKGLSPVIPETVEVEKVIPPDFSVILHDNKEEEEAFKLSLKSMVDTNAEALSEKTPRELIKTAVSMFPKLIEENEILLSREPEIKEVEKVITKEISLLSNQFIITLSEKEDILLNKISDNRKKRFKNVIQEQLPDLAKKMIFNDNVIFNLGGEFYTGIPVFK